MTGIISPYMNYIESGNCTKSQTLLLLPTIVVVMTLVFPVSSLLAKFLHPRMYEVSLKSCSQLSIGCLFGTGMIFASSFAQSFLAFLCLFSVGYGICNGIGVSISNIM